MYHKVINCRDGYLATTNTAPRKVCEAMKSRAAESQDLSPADFLAHMMGGDAVMPEIYGQRELIGTDIAIPRHGQPLWTL